VSDGAGQPGWRQAVERRLTALQQQDGRLGPLALLWATAVGVAFLACVTFFLILYWMFG
jgi:hypothetical protein